MGRSLAAAVLVSLVSLVSLASLASLAAACGDDDAGTTASPPARPTRLTSTVGVDDVSFLYPLPADVSLRLSLLGASDEGARGELLPAEIYRALPPLDTLLPNTDSYFLMRVVSVRLDPCFPGLGTEEAACQNQVRLVMQPVVPAVSGPGLTTLDLAVHLFYALGREELAGMLQELTDLRVASGLAPSEGPVGVHPALAREGMKGTFATALRALLLRHAGKDNLTRVTFMGTEQVGQVWRFGGFDRQDGKLVAMQIPLVDVREETFRNGDLDGVSFDRAATSPPSPAADDVRLLFNPGALATATDEARRAAYQSALRIENPTRHSPESIDCATCHITMAARRFAERAHGLSPEGVDGRYTHPRALPLAGATVERTDELRAFGYFDARPSISQRAVNETAEVVEHVNAVVRAAP
jgi:hypothetical protein